jgi:hypothetical protein
MDEYIIDDRNQIENAQKIRNMTDEEFELYIEKLKEEEEKDITPNQQ